MTRIRLIAVATIVSVVQLGGTAAGHAAPVGELNAFHGTTPDGTAYGVLVGRGPGPLGSAGKRGCHDLGISTNDRSAEGCATVAGKAAGLAQYDLVCDGSTKFIAGLVSSTAVRVRGTSGIGAGFDAQVRSLPAVWNSGARAWLLVLPRNEPLDMIRALNRANRVIAVYRFRASRVRCPRPVAVRRGRLQSKVTWRLVLQRIHGAGDTPNFCEELAVSQPSGPFTDVSETGLCSPVGLINHGLLTWAGGDHSCQPSYSVFTGLVSPRVSAIEVVFRDRRRLRGHLIRVDRSAHLPFNVFVAATPSNREEVRYLIWTSDGRQHSVGVPPGPPPPPCRAG